MKFQVIQLRRIYGIYRKNRQHNTAFPPFEEKLIPGMKVKPQSNSYPSENTPTSNLHVMKKNLENLRNASSRVTRRKHRSNFVLHKHLPVCSQDEMKMTEKWNLIIW